MSLNFPTGGSCLHLSGWRVKVRRLLEPQSGAGALRGSWNHSGSGQGAGAREEVQLRPRLASREREIWGEIPWLLPSSHLPVSCQCHPLAVPSWRPASKGAWEM